MEIKDWLANKGDYNTGVNLYKESGKAKSNLLNGFQKKETPRNYAKLKYELKKIAPICISANKLENMQIPTSKNVASGSANSQPLKAKDQEAQPPKAKDRSPYTSLQAHDVPKELRPVYQLQKQLYLKVCFLHKDLKQLAPEQEIEANELCLEIESIWDEIDLYWYQLDYYRDTNIVLKPKTEDFSHLTDAQLLQRRNNTRTNLTKHEKSYTKLLENLPKTDSLAVNKKYNDKLRKKETTILNNKNTLLELNKRIDKK